MLLAEQHESRWSENVRSVAAGEVWLHRKQIGTRHMAEG